VGRDKLDVRGNFRRVVFERDGCRCIAPGCGVRGEDLLDAHHILSRKIMPDGGYVLENGVSLCKEKHHLEAENGKIDVPTIRRLIGQLKDDYRHSFRKFPKVQKHPDFPTLEQDEEDAEPYSNTIDWKFMDTHFHNSMWLVQEKVDGSNLGIGFNGDGSPYLQTRGQVADPHTMNIYSTSQERNVKYAIQWAWEHLEQIQKLPPTWMVYGEWMRYRHTVPYYELPDWFIAFAVHDGEKFLLPQDTLVFLRGLGFRVPPNIDLNSLRTEEIERATRKGLWTSGAAEGVVIKSMTDGTCVKWVRREFRDQMEKHGHWRRKQLEENALASQPWAKPKETT